MTPGVQPVQWTLDGFLLTGYDAAGCRWITQRARGWRGSAPVRTDRKARLYGSGSTRGIAYGAERIIELSGTCKAPSPGARADAEHRLGQLLDPEGPLVELIRVGEDGIGHMRLVEPDDAIDPVPVNSRWFDWTIALAAPDPRKYALGWTTQAASLGGGGSGGLVATAPGAIATAPGLTAGIPPTPSTVRVINTGAATVGPVLQLTGGLETGATILEIETGVQCAFRAPIDPDTSIWINCDSHPQVLPNGIVAGGLTLPPHAVLLDGYSSRRAELAVAGWPALPGRITRTYLLTGVPTGGTPALTVHHRAASR